MEEGESFNGKLPLGYFPEPWEEDERRGAEEKRPMATKKRYEEAQGGRTQTGNGERDGMEREEIRKRALAKTATLRAELGLNKED
jgi:hypothetical protein